MAEIIKEMVAVSNAKQDFLNQAVAIMETKDYEAFERQFDYFAKNLVAHYNSVLDYALSLQNQANSYKSKKIDPYIAGGAAQAIGGVGAGIYGAVKTGERNASIDDWRKTANSQVIGARVSKDSQEATCLESYNALLSTIKKDESLNNIYSGIISKLEEDEGQKGKPLPKHLVVMVLSLILSVVVILISGTAFIGSSIAITVFAIAFVISFITLEIEFRNYK